MNSQPSPEPGNTSSIRPIAQVAESVEIIKALAVIQDGLRQFSMAGGLLRTPIVSESGIVVLAIKLRGHKLGVGPEGNFTINGISIMESRPE